MRGMYGKTGERLRMFRKEAGLSCERLVAMSRFDGGRALTRSEVYEIEAGRRKDVGLGELLRLAELLRLPLACLVVDHRDPFGPSDFPGISRGIRNDELVMLFAPVGHPPMSDGSAGSGGELLFSVSVNRLLYGLGVLRRRNAAVHAGLMDGVCGRGRLARALGGLRLRGVDRVDVRELRELCVGFCSSEGRLLARRMFDMIDGLEELERMHGCCDEDSFVRQRQRVREETRWSDEAMRSVVDGALPADPFAVMMRRVGIRTGDPYQAVRQLRSRIRTMGAEPRTDPIEPVRLYLAAAFIVRRMKTIGDGSVAGGLCDELDGELAPVVAGFRLPMLAALFDE